DSAMLLGRREQATQTYAKAMSAFTEAKLPAPFDQPAFLAFSPPGVVPGRRIQADDGYVLAEFTVDTDGRAKSIHVVEVKPTTIPKERSDALVSALKRAQLRPRYDQGRPVAVTGVRFRLPVRLDSG